jgi:hypothetical protein
VGSNISKYLASNEKYYEMIRKCEQVATMMSSARFFAPIFLGSAIMQCIRRPKCNHSPIIDESGNNSAFVAIRGKDQGTSWHNHPPINPLRLVVLTQTLRTASLLSIYLPQSRLMHPLLLWAATSATTQPATKNITKRSENAPNRPH